MQITETKIACDFCRKDIPIIKRESKAIHLKDDNGFGDAIGIWFGNISEYFWFEGEDFCSLECLIKYIRRWYKKASGDKK